MSGSTENSRLHASEVAIVGGGISGLAAAWELTRNRLPFHLFEASARLGGVIETQRINRFLIECGPDSWVAEKPWAQELATELGLGNQLVTSNDHFRRTYLVRDGGSRPRIVPIPDGMCLFMPVQWRPFLSSHIFGRGIAAWRTKLTYLLEPGRTSELKTTAQQSSADETVAHFVTRHFGRQASDDLAAPLISGMFGGDIRSLSAHAVLPSFVALEREHGSIITPLRNARQKRPRAALFSAPAQGMGTLVDALEHALPCDQLCREEPVLAIAREGAAWRLTTTRREKLFRGLILATPAHVTRKLIQPLGNLGDEIAQLLPQSFSSGIIVALGFTAEQARDLRVPAGFGILFPPLRGQGDEPRLSACTFVEQKFPQRAPPGAVLVRAFFGGAAAKVLLNEPDKALMERACSQLAPLLSRLGRLPEPALVVVRRLPLSLPQYLVGHAERMARLAELLRKTPGLVLIGNGYNGVGVSDLIREARAAALRLC